MSVRPTPETDGELKKLKNAGMDQFGKWIQTNFARKLERERDEARAVADELAAVIRTLRKHLREDNAKLEEVQREVWLWKNGKYQLDSVTVEGCKSAGEVRG